MELDDNTSILALLALRQLLYFADDYIPVQHTKLKACDILYEKRDKRESFKKGSDQE
ncbi:hypothetical protein DPMN_016983 [Dreissena polymorpha]|uniref:Uncharacterized protein n=1 Tax=Dreissena polymorpha TaxID=45954 RepID=A0A9D4NCA8_DREPO|nr:hypothetical protein DPMN_016983 [Dreissena polymorpha]